jgi:hypothetical protein
MYNNSLHVNPGIRNFWTNLRKNDSKFHVFKKNRNLVYFGNDLSKSSYEFVQDRMNNLNRNNATPDNELVREVVEQYNGVFKDSNWLTHVTNAFFKVLEIENGKEEVLKNLAIKAVCEAFEIPEDLMSPEDTSLNNDEDIEVNNTEENFPVNVEYDSLSQEIKDLINKRILINSIVQGASIHAFYTMHHLVKDELTEISPELIGLYDDISVGTVSSYWKIDYSSMLDKMNSSMLGSVVQGSSRVEYKDDTEDYLNRAGELLGASFAGTTSDGDLIFDQDSDQKVPSEPSVVAAGKTFAVLCQELTKGAIECIALHGIKDIPEEELKIVYSFADRRSDEPRYIQIGSEVWRKILVLIKKYRENEKISLPEFIMKICVLEPNDIENFFEFFMSGENDKAIALLD